LIPFLYLKGKKIRGGIDTGNANFAQAASIGL